MFGCVDPGHTEESEEQVVVRVRNALSHVPPDKLWLAPDCGLMTISREQASAKASLLAETARATRQTV